MAEQTALYYPAYLSREAIGISQNALLAGEATLADLQIWGQAAWKTPHTTYDSATRFAGKVMEEYGEFRGAFDAYMSAGRSEATATLHTEAVSELGDVVFSLTLLALNASVNLEPAMRQTIAAYADDAICLENGLEAPEPWQATARALAEKEQSLTIADIDELIEAGLEPALSTQQIIYRDEPQAPPTPEELTDRAGWIIAYLAQATHEAARQFGWGERHVSARDRTFSGQNSGCTHAAIGKMTAQLYLEAAYMARHGLDMTLSATLQHTAQKVSQRIASNRIDKTDGDRAGLTL